MTFFLPSSYLIHNHNCSCCTYINARMQSRLQKHVKWSYVHAWIWMICKIANDTAIIEGWRWS